MDTLARICETLDCGIMDVVELASDEPSTPGNCGHTLQLLLRQLLIPDL